MEAFDDTLGGTQAGFRDDAADSDDEDEYAQREGEGGAGPEEEPKGHVGRLAYGAAGVELQIWLGWVARMESIPHIHCMTIKVIPADKVSETSAPIERGYEAWKRAKIERGLAQAQDRSAMIPLEQVLRDFGLES